MAELKQFVPLSQLDAIILNHSEEDHSGALGLLLSDRADIPIYCTAACKHRLVSRYPNANFIEVANLSTLKIGTFEFRFTHTPGLHWDDNMVTYFENEQILFSNDLFGQYLGCAPPWIKTIPMMVFYKERKHISTKCLHRQHPMKNMLFWFGRLGFEMYCTWAWRNFDRKIG